MAHELDLDRLISHLIPNLSGRRPQYSTTLLSSDPRRLLSTVPPPPLLSHLNFPVPLSTRSYVTPTELPWVMVNARPSSKPSMMRFVEITSRGERQCRILGEISHRTLVGCHRDIDLLMVPRGGGISIDFRYTLTSAGDVCIYVYVK